MASSPMEPPPTTSAPLGSPHDFQGMGSGTNIDPENVPIPGSPVVQSPSGPGSVDLEDIPPALAPSTLPAPDPSTPAMPSNPGHDVTKSAKCSISYFRREPNKTVRMERTHPNVFDMITSNTALAAMDDVWTLVKPDFRWIHLPANDPDWVENAIHQILNHVVRPKYEGFRIAATFTQDVKEQILRPGFWEDQQNKGLKDIPYSRFMKPFCRQIRTSPSCPNVHSANEHMVFLAPYIHFETGSGYDKMREAIEGKGDANPSADNWVLRASLEGRNPIHIRRTLDQSYYSTLKPEYLAVRDKDQVVQRYAKDVLKKVYGEAPMLMVDQCWLWVIGGDTILTAFPRRWSTSTSSHPSETGDPTDLHYRILAYLDQKVECNKITDAKVLMYLLINRCMSSVLDPSFLPNSDLEFMRFFSESIDKLMAEQTLSLKQLWDDVEKTEDGPLTDSMFRMRADFETLRKIKDISEELLMLKNIVDQQDKSLRLLESEAINPMEAGIFDGPASHRSANSPSPNRAPGRETIESPHLGPPRQHTSPSLQGRPVSPQGQPASDPGHDPGHETAIMTDQQSGERAPRPQIRRQRKKKKSKTLKEVLAWAEVRTKELAELREKAETTYQALIDLLDLKQRQARLSEAVQARRSATELEEQSNSIMLFTVVTILFLPLSSLASIFGVNAKEFGASGSILGLGRIFAYLFPISALVVGLSFLLAFNHNLRKILLLWIKIASTKLFLKFPTAKAVAYVEKLETELKNLHDTKEEQQKKRNLQTDPNAGEEGNQVGDKPENVVAEPANETNGMRHRLPDGDLP